MNKSIFITGGTSGVGKALINEFAKNNYNIFFTYFKNLKEAKLISKNLQNLNIEHDFVKMDLSKKSSINHAFKRFSDKFKKFNIFINNASPKIKREQFLRVKDSNILGILNTLLVGNIISLKNALKHLLNKRDNSESIIINISSYSAITGGKNIHLYAASNAALNILTKALSEDKFKKRIKIISVVPRYIDTPTFRKNNNIKNENDLNFFKKNKKIKLIKKPGDFSKFIYNKIIKNKVYRKKQIIYYHTN
jgi:NAD(P)-dependent dehydrogenase (short-subunit alcohol dehydrogenase family)